MSFDTKLNKCTYETTKDSFQPQYWKRCYKCWPQEEKGACLQCIAVCHDGHTVDVNVRYGNFYCDCGSDHTNCKLKGRMSVFPSPIDTEPLFPRDIAIPRQPHPAPHPHPFFPVQPQLPRPQSPPRFPLSTPPTQHTPPTQLSPPSRYGDHCPTMGMMGMMGMGRGGQEGFFQNSAQLPSNTTNTTNTNTHPTPMRSESPDLPSSGSPPGTF